jgi:exopolysaccharide biosynthesis polyprenyl glycosylphosphotransferase
MMPTDLSSTTATPAVRTGLRRAPTAARRGIAKATESAVLDVVATFALIGLTAPLAGSMFGAAYEGASVGILSGTGVLMVALGLLGLVVAGEYSPRVGTGRPLIKHFGRLLLVAAVVAWTVLLLSAAAGEAADLSQMFALSLTLPLAWTGVRWAGEVRRSRRPERVLVIGTGRVAQRVLAVAGRNPRLGLNVVGFVDDYPLELKDDAPPVLGGLADLDELLEGEDIDRVMVAFSPRSDGEILRVLRECDRHDVRVDVVPRFFDLMSEEPVAHSIGGLALVGVRARQGSIVQLAVKRAVDIAAAGIALLLLSPALAAVSVAIKLSDGGAVFFRQVRVGRDGRLFRVLKFRTMSEGGDVPEAMRLAFSADDAGLAPALDADEMERLVETIKTQGEQRVTRIGGLLRKTSLDELPQLWNVLLGQMSLVGPRPLRPFEVATLESWQTMRQAVRPGITGLWQILGRSEIPWGERMQLDYTYVRHWSLATDLRILAGTVPAVLRRKGAM